MGGSGAPQAPLRSSRPGEAGTLLDTPIGPNSGEGLPPATFLGALVVGLAASMVREPLHVPRIALTVPRIIMMTPGLYAFQTIVLLNQGRMTEAIAAGAVCCFAVGAIAMGLIATRFLTERRWRFER